MKQETREWVAWVTSWGAWIVAATLTFLRSTQTIGAQYSMVIVLLIGVAMAAGIKLSRMRLTATMLDVYRAGIETAKVQKEERDEMERRIIGSHDKEMNRDG